MKDGNDGSGTARGGTIYHSPVAACEVIHFGQSYGFHLAANNTYWLHCDSRTHFTDACLTIDLLDIFHGTTKYAEIKSDNHTHNHMES